MTLEYIKADPSVIYLDGYRDGANLILDIIDRAAKRHPRESAQKTLTTLSNVLNEGLKQWLSTLETVDLTSRNSLIPRCLTPGEVAVNASTECITRDTTPRE